MAESSVPDHQCRACGEFKSRDDFYLSPRGDVWQPCKPCKLHRTSESRRLLAAARRTSDSKRCGCCGEAKPRSGFHREPYNGTTRGTRTCLECIDRSDFTGVEKRCSACQETKAVSDFPSERFKTQSGATITRFSKRCKGCDVSYRRSRRHDNWETWQERYREVARKRTPEQKFRWYLSTNYGLTVEEYQALVDAQDGRCAICREIPEPQKHKRGFQIDHCHSTNKIRGLLCHNCNVAVGHLKEDPVRIRRLLEYVKRHLV